MSHSYLYLFIFFLHFFSHPPISSPIPIKYIFFSFTHHTKNEKKKPQLQKKNLAVEEEARNNSGFMCLCWN